MKFPGGGNMQNMLAQAQKMQAEMKTLQERLAKRELTSESAGGRIKITINGKQEIQKIEINKDLIDPNDAAMLADLIKVAVNEAVDASQKMVAGEMSRIVPPGLAGMF